MQTFLDTHAWLWWVTSDDRISRKALSEIRLAISREGVWISAISIWEIAKKVQKRHLALDRPVREWLDQATRVEGLFIAELSTEVLVESCELPPPFHGDPTDQIIVASVRHYEGRLITRDERMRRYPHLKSRW